MIGAHKNEKGELKVKSEQIIFADVPKEGNLGETSGGTWVYYLEPESEKEKAVLGEMITKRIRGELFRVDDALTNEGERIVSDTKFITLPDTLPEVTMTGGGRTASAGQREDEDPEASMTESDEIVSAGQETEEQETKKQETEEQETEEQETEEQKTEKQETEGGTE